MRFKLLALSLLLAAAGCQARQLRSHVVRQAESLTDIEYQQVLDNLAMFKEDPNALPFFSLPAKGSVGIQNTSTVQGGLNWDYTFFGAANRFVNLLDKKNLGFNASQQNIANWSTDSVINPEELALMRCAYQRVIGCEGPECAAPLAAFFAHSGMGRLESIQPGWFCVGRLKDVPRGASYVGHYGHTYVWVMPEGMDGLTKFTLAILDIATRLPVPAPDPLALRLADMERRLVTSTEVYNKLPDKQSVEGTRLKIDVEKLLGQYNAALEEKLKQPGTQTDLFQHLRKEFRGYDPGPNFVPKP